MRAVVTSDIMYSLEEKTLSQGQVSVQEMMEAVAMRVAQEALLLFHHFHTAPQIVLLVGKGNNGADALAAGIALKRKGSAVFFCQIEDGASSPLFNQKKELLLAHGGKELFIEQLDSFFPQELPLIIIDGIYGIGFKGAPSLKARRAIEWANGTLWPKISVDIPSGINPNTGQVVVNAIRADITVACQFPKKGLFFHDGWEHAGEIAIADIGLLHDSRSPEYILIEEEDYASHLPVYARTQDKFSRGRTLVAGGSQGLIGALILSLQAALTTGTGYLTALLRLDLASSIPHLPIEAVKDLFPECPSEYARYVDAKADHADALLLGPGMGRDSTAEMIFKALWNRNDLLRVIDADALYFLSHQEMIPHSLNNAILTPHKGEAMKLLSHGQRENDGVCTKIASDEALIKGLRTSYSDYAPTSTILLKGAPTFVIHGQSASTYIIAGGDPGMATLGSGDVLAGMIASFLSQTHDAFSSTILGAGIHALAGKLAAKRWSSYAVTASRIRDEIPSALTLLMNRITNGTFRSYMPSCRTKFSSIENNL